MKKLLFAFVIILLLTGCAADADIASRNLSAAADQFEVMRRIVFYNGITDTYIMTIEGLCSLGNTDTAIRMSVTCKTGPTSYKKHYLGLSDNVTFFAEHLDASQADVYHHRIIFKPEAIIPNIDLETSGGK